MVKADIYLHNPRGSNDRGCETNENRNNGNRLFDSQNNAKGGYACGAAYPFACYLLTAESDRRTCNEINANGTYFATIATFQFGFVAQRSLLFTLPTL
jgi:hypothetical protein